MINLKQGDCLQLLREIPRGSVDMILCDLPYGTTHNIWDKKIDIKSLWCEYRRVIKSGGQSRYLRKCHLSAI
jgi:DNA modification methylase